VGVFSRSYLVARHIGLVTGINQSGTSLVGTLALERLATTASPGGWCGGLVGKSPFISGFLFSIATLARRYGRLPRSLTRRNRGNVSLYQLARS
jgi:hypothetical protein